jgi:hypothetical protein
MIVRVGEIGVKWVSYTMKIVFENYQRFFLEILEEN